MIVRITLISEDRKQVLRNLVKMYCYEWSQYNGIDVDQNGDYAFEHELGRFFEKYKHYPYLVEIEGKPAGFVLVDTDICHYRESEYAISEAFILHKYRKTGVGKQAVTEIFKRHRGKWEIKMHPKNMGAMDFWKNVVTVAAKEGKYKIQEECKDARYDDGTFGTVIGFETADV